MRRGSLKKPKPIRRRRSRSGIIEVLQHGGFSLHAYIGRRLNIGFLTQCCLLAAIAALLIFIGSVIDGTLFLEGRSIGLLEHPGIWAFFGLQIALPLSIRQSLKKLLRAQSKISAIANLNDKFSQAVVTPLLEFLRLRNNESRVIATIIYGAGLIAFVWNTYQNQLPGIIVPYDFWDSSNHFFGYWLTRVYKLYLFCWLLPYIALVHAAILIITLRLVRQARLAGRFKLDPFHPDGVGGLGFVPGLITTPIIVAVLMISLPTAAAFEVHRAADVTPLIGLTIMLAWTGIAYVVPILYLRADIVATKRATIKKLRQLQQACYFEIVKGNALDYEKVKDGNEALEYFEKVSNKVSSISNYPHLKRLIGYLGLALTPSAISFTVNYIVPFIRPLLQKP
jgi:hypothetical protein